MNDEPIQACNLNLDMTRLKNEVLNLFAENANTENLKYGNNINWDKIHLWDCYNKDDMTKPELWTEINTVRSMKFHYDLSLGDFVFKPNQNFDKCPYLKEILASITYGNIDKAKIYICDISVLKKYGEIRTHVDHAIRPYMSNENKWKRFHIPIITNKKVFFIMNKKTYNLEEGLLYKLRTTLPHSVFNTSDMDRYHLIFDTDPQYVSSHLKWYSPKNLPPI